MQNPLNTTLIKEISDFLNKAHKNTYANKNAKQSESSRLNSSDYYYKDKDFIYHDSYFGSRDFIGGEIIYKSNISIWGLNYFGYILNNNLNEEDIYTFLRKALLISDDNIIPVRGPKYFKENKWEYIFEVTGDLLNFKGEEYIKLKNTIVYKCLVHGGLIK